MVIHDVIIQKLPVISASTGRTGRRTDPHHGCYDIAYMLLCPEYSGECANE